jgi:6,7-dimethyl-8-ribityllumazine synthase
VIRGETYHFEVIADAVAQGVVAAAGETGIPITFGVLTTDTLEQALARAAMDRTNKGWEAAVAAIEMALLGRRLAAPEAAS